MDAKYRGVFECKPSYRLFQGHDAFFAYPVTQKMTTVPVVAVKLHMGTSVGQADVCIGVVKDLVHNLLIGAPLSQEDCIEVFFHRKVQEGIDDASALRLGELTQ